MAADLLDPIPLSALQYGCYCWCQCTLIRIEQVFAENLYTLPGQALHKGADSRVGILEIASPPGNGGRGFKPPCMLGSSQADNALWLHAARRRFLDRQQDAATELAYNSSR